MSYIQSTAGSISGPFAQLRITSAPASQSTTQWDSQSQSWVSSSNVADGNCIMWGLIAVFMNATNNGIGSLRFTSTSDSYLYSQYEQGTVTSSRSNSGEVMLNYGKNATWNYGTAYLGDLPIIDNDRNRCMLMRME